MICAHLCFGLWICITHVKFRRKYVLISLKSFAFETKVFKFLSGTIPSEISRLQFLGMRHDIVCQMLASSINASDDR